MSAPKTAANSNTLRAFLSATQLAAVIAGARGEEGQFFRDKMAELRERIATMPETYDQDGKSDPIAYLHYFTAGADWYITEKDSDPDGEGQVQAYGLADIFRDGGERGYISIPELLAHRAELDFHFTPRPLSEIHA